MNENKNKRFNLKTPIRYHINIFANYIESSREKSFKFADLVITTASGPYFCHKLVLACFSKLFYEYLSQNADIDISLIDMDTPGFNYIRGALFEKILDFLYTGKLEIHNSLTEDLGKLGRNLCIELLDKYLTSPNTYATKPSTNFMILG
ncbi:unnamed protein product [Gordionus sp. m RMFG-2023]